MFGCCCVNKKAPKKEQQKAAAAKDTKNVGDGDGKEAEVNKCDKNKYKLPPRPPATDVASLKSPTTHDKSNSSDDDNNLSGLIMSDGLVGKSFLRILFDSGWLGWFEACSMLSWKNYDKESFLGISRGSGIS